MTTYAYLRVSTDQQDMDNQRYGLFSCKHGQGLLYTGGEFRRLAKARRVP
jgi:DNA invertase Pin-like site-specific DNA recombinase